MIVYSQTETINIFFTKQLQLNAFKDLFYLSSYFLFVEVQKATFGYCIHARTDSASLPSNYILTLKTLKQGVNFLELTIKTPERRF